MEINKKKNRRGGVTGNYCGNQVLLSSKQTEGERTKGSSISSRYVRSHGLYTHN